MLLYTQSGFEQASLRVEQFLSKKSQRAAYFIEDDQCIEWLIEDEAVHNTESGATRVERPRE